MSNKFNIGDVVKWTSKAGGHALEKSGSVIEIVPAGSSPKANLGHHAGGAPRSIESYIIAVPQKSRSKSPRPMKAKLYWPHVGVLTKIGSDMQFAEAVQQMASEAPVAVS
jgi:hypothetical protein